MAEVGGENYVYVLYGLFKNKCYLKSLTRQTNDNQFYFLNCCIIYLRNYSCVHNTTENDSNINTHLSFMLFW